MMRSMIESRVWLVAAILATLTVVPARAQRPTDLVSRGGTTGRVVGIVDGDTVDVLIPPARRVRVRLYGVDAPESGEPFSQQARQFARVLMFSRDVAITGKDVDVYGRLVARVVVDGTDASEAIIAAGLACTFRQFVSDPLLDTAQSRAREARSGFWAIGASKPACVARESLNGSASRATSTPLTPGFIGNTRSRVYHSPACRNATCKNCSLKFATRGEAEAAGFRPARDCIRP